jgi:hypothetical protein
MKKTLCFLTVCACLLTPATARADDGGFWDWLFHWDTHFFGYGTEFHLVCLTGAGEIVDGCEEGFKNLKYLFRSHDQIPHAFVPNVAGTERPEPIEFKDIRHEINLRVSFMHSVGDGLATEPNGVATTIYALKLLGMYNLRIDQHLEIGAGVGAMPIFGDQVNRLWRPILMASVVVSPGGINYWRFDYARYGSAIAAPDGVRSELSSAVDHPEWRWTVSTGFDLRRVGCFKNCRKP